MNYHNIKHCDMVNGSGLRTVIWVSGCPHHCKGCFNKETWDKDSGILFDNDAKLELFEDLDKDWCSGVTFSGGDPLADYNFNTILSLCKQLKLEYPTKTIWLYTGYTWDDIINDEIKSIIIPYIDVICDGKFIEDLKCEEFNWVGSTNQYVISVVDRINKIKNLKCI